MESDSSDSGSDEPYYGKRGRPHDARGARQNRQYPSRWARDVIIESGRNVEHARHNIAVVVNNRKRRREHWEQSIQALYLAEVDKSNRPRCLQSLAGASASSSQDHVHTIELNNDEKIKLHNEEMKKIKNDDIYEFKSDDIIDSNSPSTSGLRGTQTSPIQRNDKNRESNDLKNEEDVNKDTGKKLND